jgi:ABC-type uncharacterized transport system permease subunit
MQVLTVLLPVAYLVAAVLYAMSFGGPRAPHVDRPRRIAFALALVLHAGLFAMHAYASGGFPKVATTWEATSAVALCTALLFLLVERKRSEAEASTGSVVLGAVFAMQLVASSLGPIEALPARAGLVDALHVGTSALACSAVVLSGIHGGLYLLLYRQMRRRSFGVLFQRLPDLQHLSRLTRLSALNGFILLGIGLNVGIGLAHLEGVEGFSYTDPFVLVCLGLWLHFGLVAFSGKIPGLSARRAAFAAAGGFVVLLLALVLTLTPISFHESV